MHPGHRTIFRLLPAALVATVLIVLGPPALVVWLAPGRSLVFSVVACGGLAVIASRAGDALWRRFPASRDLLFADLMLWGWLRRVRTERQLERAQSLLRDAGPADRPAALEEVVAMMEARDAYTHQHSLRVSRYAEGIARQLGFAETQVERIRAAAALHDVGKLFTPREILNKPGRLTDEEFAEIKRHPGAGADLVSGIVGQDIVAMIRYHHERLGGNGYPSGLTGAAIPMGARIIAVADTFDAMTSTRAYRRARAHQKALTALKQEAGTALDASVVTAFIAFYSGRRGLLASNVASGFSPAVASLRELLGSGAARIAPLIGTSAMVAAPMMTQTLPSLAMADRDAPHRAVASQPRDARIVRPRTAYASAPAVLVGRSTLLADHMSAVARLPEPAVRLRRHPRPKPAVHHAPAVDVQPATMPVLVDAIPAATAEPVSIAIPVVAVPTATPGADATPGTVVVVKATPSPTPAASPSPTPAAIATPDPTPAPSADPLPTSTPTPVPTPNVTPLGAGSSGPGSGGSGSSGPGSGSSGSSGPGPGPSPTPSAVATIVIPLPNPLPPVIIPLPRG